MSETIAGSAPAKQANLRNPPDDAPHVLVVDDDHRIRDLLKRYLVDHGFRVTAADNVEAGRAAMRGLAFDLVVLDVMMPGKENGLDLARELKTTTEIPVCMLTARSESGHRIEGLELGVDEYIPKPFEPRELLLRLQNILRRREPAVATKPPDEMRMGGLIFYVTRGELKRGEETIKLTERERDMLRLFAERPGQPIPRYQLASDETTGSERAVDVQINRLRRKIETDPSNPVYLQTVRGKGYILHMD